MAGYLSYASTKNENRILLCEVKKWAARCTDEPWSYYIFDSAEKAADKLEKEPCIHLFGWDITEVGSLEILKRARKRRRDPLLLLVADTGISPADYLKPSISPEALLLKPLNQKNIQAVLREIFEELQNRFYTDAHKKDIFTAESREGKVVLPVGLIDSFEARNKKIYVRAGEEEYGFYSSLEEIKKKLPEKFVQCHRSFIINMEHVWKVNFVHLTLCMKNGAEIPFSRRYRQMIREYWGGK